MQPVTAAKVKYGIWGLIIGAIIAMIVGFVWGGWTTTGTAQTMSDEAVLASRAAICVAQFMKQPNHEEQLKAFVDKIAGIKLNSLKKGAGIKCLGKKRLVPLSPGHAPRGLNCLGQNEAVMHTFRFPILANSLPSRCINFLIILILFG